MRWRVTTTNQMPSIDIQNVYAHNIIRAAEIVAEVHGIVGYFLVFSEENPKSSIKVLITKNQAYVGKYLR